MLYQGIQLTRDALNAAYLSKMEGGTTGGNITISKDDPTVVFSNSTTSSTLTIHVNDWARIESSVNIYTPKLFRADGGLQVYNGANKNFEATTDGAVTAIGIVKGSTFQKTDGTEVSYQGHIHAEFLSKTNTTAYTPTADYHPATKKYVDDTHNIWGNYMLQINQAMDSLDIIYLG